MIVEKEDNFKNIKEIIRTIKQWIFLEPYTDNIKHSVVIIFDEKKNPNLYMLSAPKINKSDIANDKEYRESLFEKINEVLKSNEVYKDLGMLIHVKYATCVFEPTENKKNIIYTAAQISSYLLEYEDIIPVCIVADLDNDETSQVNIVVINYGQKDVSEIIKR